MTFQKFSWSEAQAAIFDARGSIVQARAIQIAQVEEGGLLRILGPAVSAPLQSSHGTQACSGSRYGKQHMLGTSEGIK